MSIKIGDIERQLPHGMFLHKDNAKAREMWNKSAAQGNENAIKFLNILDEEERTITTKTFSRIFIFVFVVFTSSNSFFRFLLLDVTNTSF